MSLKASEQLETNRYQLEILIPAEPFAEALAKVFVKKGKNISVPGFRKGKAPRLVIERMYGREVFYDDAVNMLYPKAVEDAMEEAGLTLADERVEFNLISVSEEDGVNFKITCTVKPEVTLKQYKGLAAERKIVTVDQTEIDAELERLQKRNSRIITVEDRPAAKGDTVEFDFDGYVDDQAFEGGKMENYSLKLGSEKFIPGFEEQIAGKSAGEEFDVTVTFPEDYYVETLKGKPAVFKCKLHEIKAVELPECDDEFARDVSEFDTLEELKNDIKAKIEHRKTHESDDDAEHQLVKALASGMTAEIPDVMVERRMDGNLRDFTYHVESQGVKFWEYLAHTGSTEEEFREQFRPQAEEQVKIRLALEKVAALEGISVSQEEIDAEYTRLAEQHDTGIDRVKKAIPQKEVTGDLTVKKAIDLIKETAVIQDVAEHTPKADDKKEEEEKKTVTVKGKGRTKSAVKEPDMIETTATEIDTAEST
ncbi:MAG: trigger factor [Oscillospiraceae bacterium]|jgi:trigger factor|nr:trigger factor [Oscillospiraceae bacterium]